MTCPLWERIDNLTLGVTWRTLWYPGTKGSSPLFETMIVAEKSVVVTVEPSICGIVVMVMTRCSVVTGNGRNELAIDAIMVSSVEPGGACVADIWMEACPFGPYVCMSLSNGINLIVLISPLLGATVPFPIIFDV